MKSKYIVAVIISIMAMTCQAQITLGSRRAVRDSLTGDWLCSIPEGVFGSDYSATFHTTEPWLYSAAGHKLYLHPGDR